MTLPYVQAWQCANLYRPVKNVQWSVFQGRRRTTFCIARLRSNYLRITIVHCQTEQRTVASSEFLRLATAESGNRQPEAVLWMLRTWLYRDSRKPAAVEQLPSRSPSQWRGRGYRSGSDYGRRETQTSIATEARRRREEARRLRIEAETGWQAAKRWFEEQLLGPVQA